MPALRSKLHRLHEDIDKFEYALGDGLGGASEAGATAGAASKNGRQAAKTTSTTTRTVTPTKRKPVRAFAQKRRQATIAGEKRDIPVVRHNLTSKYPFVDDRGTVEQIIEGAGDKRACLFATQVCTWGIRLTLFLPRLAVWCGCSFWPVTSSIGVQTSRKAASGTDGMCVVLALSGISAVFVMRHAPSVCSNAVCCSGTATPESNDVLDDDWVGGQDDDMVANASTAAESVAVSHTPAGYRYRNRKQAVTSTTQTPRGSASKAKGPSGTAAARRSRKYKHGKAGAKGKYGYPAGAAKKGGVTWGRGVPQHASAWCQPSVLPPPATTAAAAAAAAAGVAPGMAWVYPYPAVPSSTPCPVAAHAMGQPMMSPFFYGSPAMVPSYHQHPLQHPQQHWTQEQVAAAVAAAVASSKQPATVPPKATQGTHARPSATGASVARSRSNTQSAPKSKPRQDATAAEKPPSSGKRRTPATRVSTSAAVPAKATVVRPGRHAKKAAGGNSVSESTREAMRRDRAAARAAKARRPARWVGVKRAGGCAVAACVRGISSARRLCCVWDSRAPRCDQRGGAKQA